MAGSRGHDHLVHRAYDVEVACWDVASIGTSGDPAAQPARAAASSDGRAHVAALGDLNLDLTLEVPAHPRPGGDAIATAQRSAVGGSATNTAIVLARAGVDCRLLARVGDDPWGRHLLATLRGEGEDAPDVAAVQVDPDEPTQVNVVAVTPDGERTMYAYRGANTRLTATYEHAAVVGASEVLHVSAYAWLAGPQRAAADAALRAAAAAGVPVVVDVPVGPAEAVPDRLRAILPAVHTLVVSPAEARALAGVADDELAVARLLELGVTRVACKLGEEGCRLVRASGQVTVAAEPVVPVDTTGAGDSFAAGVVLGLVDDRDDRSTGRLANELGGLAVSRHGAGLALASREQIAALLGQTGAGYARDRSRDPVDGPP